MNTKSYKEFNRFKELVGSKGQAGWSDEIKAFRAIKEAEDADIDDCISSARRFILVGVKNGSSARPVVYNYDEGSEYPKPKKLVFFPKIDLFQNIIELQDTIDVVSDLKTDLGLVEESFSPEEIELFSVSVVYGKGIKKGHKLVPHLTLGEVTSQLSYQYPCKSKMLFYVCDTAEECGNLTTHAGYHAYRVAVYEAAELPDGVNREISIDGHLMATILSCAPW